ncbi:MAG TPA: T9SS type A sorting domain-containing protein, partial [Aequorivita sp.]|nr:T9SS type A sorting domain-containing protein [Aequorivita sp.]
MKKILLVVSVLLSSMTFAQGHETFDNLDLTGNSYLNGSFVGQDGITWTYGQSRGDIELNGKALTLGRNRAEDMFLESAALTNGVGTLEFSYSQAFSNPVNLEVLVNGVLVYTATSDDEQGVIKSSGLITVEAEAGAVIKFNNPNGAQVTLDDIIWTAFDNGGGGTFPDPYCDITNIAATDVEEITNVEFGGTTIENDDFTSILVDKTDVIVEIEQSETYTISVEGNTHSTGFEFDNNIVAFIDWNQNGILDDAGEIYEVGNISGSDGNDGVAATMDITVPADAALGQTRIRITKTYWDEDSAPLLDPCAIEFDPWGMGNYPSYGQALDFTLEITEASDTGFTCDFAHEVVGDADGGSGSSVDSTFKSAVDFAVPAGQNFTLSTIQVPFLTMAPEDAPITAQVVYYENDGGLPGTEIGSETVVPTILSSGEWVNPAAYEFITQLDMTPITFNGSHNMDTTYWVEISMGTATNQATVFWAYTTGAGLEGAPMARFDSDLGTWAIPDDGASNEGIYNFSGECSLMDSQGDCTGTPDGGIASVNPEQGNINTTYTVSASGFSGGYDGMTYQWQSNTNDAGWVNEGDSQTNYSAYTATAPSDVGVEVAWRLEVTCTLSSETSYSEIATFTSLLDYCNPVLDCTWDEMITNVTFQEIDNTTACSPDGYGDYTDMIAMVQAAETYPISIAVGEGFDPVSTSVWIDFNNNGNFEEDEFFYIGNGSGEVLTGNISIPAAIENGSYRMRVRVAAVDPSGATWDMACNESQAYGETEDYTVTVDGVVGVGTHDLAGFTYYPNPTNEILNLSSQKNIETIELFNMLGQKVVTSNVNATSTEINLSGLAMGTYIMNVTIDGQTGTYKVI